jgi:hypothetical protein
MRDRMIDAQHNQGGGRGQVLEGRWSRRELARLRSAADPEIDQVVAAYHRQHPELTDPRNLVRSMIQELSQAKRDPQRFTRAVRRRQARHAARTGVRRLSERGTLRRRS